VASNEKDLQKVVERLEEARALKEAELEKYEPLDLLIQQATDRQSAVADQDKVAQEDWKEAKAAVSAVALTLREYKVYRPRTCIC
jgi:hypothetical protein